AEEHKLLARGEDRLVVRTLGVEPELEHPARAVERAGNRALAVELAHVAQVHEDDVVRAVTPACVLEAQSLDAALPFVDELPEAFLEPHWTLSISSSPRRLRRQTPRTGGHMAIIRIYTGSDGKSHFEDISPRLTPRGDQSDDGELIPGSGIVVRRFDPKRSN